MLLVLKSHFELQGSRCHAHAPSAHFPKTSAMEGSLRPQSLRLTHVIITRPPMDQTSEPASLHLSRPFSFCTSLSLSISIQRYSISVSSYLCSISHSQSLLLSFNTSEHLRSLSSVEVISHAKLSAVPCPLQALTLTARCISWIWGLSIFYRFSI